MKGERKGLAVCELHESLSDFRPGHRIQEMNHKYDRSIETLNAFRGKGCTRSHDNNKA